MKRKILITTGFFVVIIFGLGMIAGLGKNNSIGSVSELNTSSSTTPDVSTSIKMKTMSNDIAGKTLWTNTDAWKTSTLSVADFNNDGIDDILASERDPRAMDGTTGTTFWIHDFPFGYLISSTAVGNFNNDGTPDAVVGSYDNNTYAINGATGGLLWNFTDATDDITSVAVGDFNNDGTEDALVGSRDTNVYAVNGADGTQFWNNTDPTTSIVTMAVGDFNSDNIDDAVVNYGNNGLSTVYAINGADGTQLWNNTDPYYWIISIVVLDYNQDSYDDVIVSEASGSNIQAIDGATGETRWTTAISRASLALGDFNGDGVEELAAASSDNNLYTLTTSTGEIDWTNRDSSGTLDEIAVGDVNGDGIDDIITGGSDSNVYAVSGVGGILMWKNSDPFGSLLDIQLGHFNGDGTLDVVVSITNPDYGIYVITGYTPPTTQLEVTLVLSKTYVNLTNDWTMARVVVTNVGAFPAEFVFVVIYAPDGSDDLMALYDTILPSRSKQSQFNLTSGSGLPTTKIPNALEISYTVSVLVGSYNSPWEMVGTPIIVDPPLDEEFTPEDLTVDNSSFPAVYQIESFAIGMIIVSFAGVLGALGFGFFKKRKILSEDIPSGD